MADRAESLEMQNEVDCHVKHLRERIDGFLTANQGSIRDRVLACMSAVLHCQMGQLAANESLYETAGAESMDFMEIIFRLQEQFGVEIPIGSIQQFARDGIEKMFEVDGYLTDRAVARLCVLMPEVPVERVTIGIRGNEIPRLFTSETFVRLIAWRLLERTREHAGETR